MTPTANARLTSTARWVRQTLTNLFTRINLFAMFLLWASLSASIAQNSDAPVVVIVGASLAVATVLSSGLALTIGGLIGMVESCRTK